MEEIPGEIVKAKYDSLSLEEKLKYFTVFYRIVDEGDEWVYQYWLFYVFNNSNYHLKYKNYIDYYFGNDHYGDFESVFVFVDKKTTKVSRVVGSVHNGTEAKIILLNNELINSEFGHVTVLIEKGGHGNYLDGNNDGMVNPTKDVKLINWLNLYPLLTKLVWSEEDRLYGVKIQYDDKLYKLTPLSDFSDRFIAKYGPDRKLLVKSPTLGSFKRKSDEKKQYFTEAGGHVTRAPWDKTKVVYYDSDQILPFSS